MSVFDTSKTTTTTLPSWFSTAQQAVAKQAPITYGGVDGVGGVTDPSKTVASGLVSDLNSATANGNQWPANGPKRQPKPFPVYRGS